MLDMQQQQQTDSIISPVDRMEVCGSFVTRQDIINFPFPYKLWLVVQLDFCDFLRWNRDGTVVLLDLVVLEDYLNSARSIFKIKNRSIFLEHLEQFKFERLNAMPEAEEDLLLQYKNENFQRHRLDLLAKMRRQSASTCQSFRSQTEPSNSVTIGGQPPTHSMRVVERMLGDLCFMSHGALSNVQKSRLRFQTILNFQNETRTLQEKLQASDEHAATQLQQRRFKTLDAARGVSGSTLIASLPVEEEQVIELPIEMFENPHDSVLHLGEDFRPEYAGYYGNCSKNQILHFFGDYLPMYEDGSMEVKKIVTEANSVNQFPQNVENEQTNEEGPPIQDEDSKVSDMTSPLMSSQKSMPTINLSSALEPIFKPDDEDDSDQVYNVTAPNVTAHNEIDLELSMDEFIKFNNTNHEQQNEKKDDQATSSSEGFPQMPSAVKIEITDEDDSENEANFRNFFSQYRASLNLLYERH